MAAQRNARGEFVWLAVEGTLDCVVSGWAFDASISRSTQAASRFMLCTMAQLDGARRQLDEMAVARRSAWPQQLGCDCIPVDPLR